MKYVKTWKSVETLRGTPRPSLSIVTKWVTSFTIPTHKVLQAGSVVPGLHYACPWGASHDVQLVSSYPAAVAPFSLVCFTMGTGTAGLFSLCWNHLCIWRWIPCRHILDLCFGDTILYKCGFSRLSERYWKATAVYTLTAAANKLPTLGPELSDGTCFEMLGKESPFGTEPVFSLHDED